MGLGMQGQRQEHLLETEFEEIGLAIVMVSQRGSKSRSSGKDEEFAILIWTHKQNKGPSFKCDPVAGPRIAAHQMRVLLAALQLSFLHICKHVK